jgi:CDP-diacylglycerol--serine O-phosphatidyltransferase
MVPRRHFSMIREFHLADFLTLGNAACGVGAVLLALLYVESRDPMHFFTACALAPAAFAFDVFDGKVARARNEHSALGRELDSLADVISFGVAPAALGFAAGLRGGWDALVLVYFACCGVSRLARFNVTAEKLSEGGPDERGDRRGAGLCRVGGPAGQRQPPGRRVGARAVAPAPAGAPLRALGHAHDQQDAEDPEALRPRGATRRASA